MTGASAAAAGPQLNAYRVNIDDGQTLATPAEQGFDIVEGRLHLRKLDRGGHRFKVRAVDAAGNKDETPAKWRWRIVRRR